MNADLADSVNVFEMSGSTVIVEDDSGRISLDLSHDRSTPLVTGVCLGFYGYESSSSGCFVVKDICYPLTGDPKAFISSNIVTNSKQPDGKILIISDVGTNPGLLFSALSLLNQVSLFIFCGNYLNSVQDGSSLHVDCGFESPVLLIPGSGDPTSKLLPQPPVVKILLPASRDPNVISHTNPCSFSFNQKVSFVGSSGQTIEDIKRYLPSLSTIEIASHLLKWGHVAPTAPTTLPSLPLSKDDPFVIEAAPNVLFFGNQTAFGWSMVGETMIISVPKYSETKQGAILDIPTMSVSKLQIQDSI